MKIVNSNKSAVKKSVKSNPKKTILKSETANSFIYTVALDVEPGAVVQNNIQTIDVSIFTDQLTQKKSTLSKSSTPVDTIKKSLTMSSSKKQEASQRKDSAIARGKIDLTKSVNNSHLGSAGTHKVLVTETVDSSSRSIPVLKVDRVDSKVNNVAAGEMTSQESAHLLLNMGIDPSTIHDKNAIIDAHESVAGTITHKKKTTKYEKNIMSNMTDVAVKSNKDTNVSKDLGEIVPAGQTSQSMFNTQFVNKDSTRGAFLDHMTDSTSFSKKAAVSVMKKVQKKSVTLKTDIIVAKADLKSAHEFSVSFDVKDATGTVVHTEKMTVPHHDHLAELKKPKIPPTISGGKTKDGFNSLSIQQADLNAKTVQIYRKDIPNSIPMNQTSYKLIDEVGLSTGNSLKYVDSSAKDCQSIYRVISVGDNGDKSETFSSQIIQRAKKVIPEAHKENKPDYGTLTTLVDKNRIKVEIRNIPPHAISCGLTRRDLSLKETKFILIKTDPDIVLLNNNVSSVTLIDLDFLKHGHIYEYRAEFILKFGSVVMSTVNSIRKFMQEISDQIQITTDDLKVDQEQTDLTMTLNVVPKSTIFSSAVEALTKSGVASYFQDQIKSDSAKINDLVSIKVIRKNLTKGKEDHLGFLPNDTYSFKDSELSSKIDIEPAQPGNEYEYTFQPFLRSPDTLLDNTLRKEKSASGINFQYSPKKFKNPKTLSEGVIFKHPDQHQNTSGDIGTFKSVKIKFDEKKSAVQSITVQKTRSDSNLITWTMSTFPKDVDHFMVAIEYLGSVHPVGSVHSQNSANKFTYTDDINLYQGAVRYSVTPVYADYSYGNAAFTRTIIND